MVFIDPSGALMTHYVDKIIMFFYKRMMVVMTW